MTQTVGNELLSSLLDPVLHVSVIKKPPERAVAPWAAEI